MATWLFQANPDTFDVDGYLVDRERITWSVNQEHLAAQMAPGDDMYLWRAIGSSGDREVSGIVAKGQLVEAPAVFEEEPESRPFWKDAGGHGPSLRGWTRITKVANKRELLNTGCWTTQCCLPSPS